MCFSSKTKKAYHQMYNRMTEGPIKFDQNQIQQLRKKSFIKQLRFDKVAGYRPDIQKIAFKKNMGILGLQSAFQFSDRLFNSFDIDNDGKVFLVLCQISFHDFLEYMEVLKAGTEKHKARISFKLIDYTNRNKFNKEDFVQYLSDFFKSWSSITNMTITPEIKERTDLYVDMIFRKVKQDKGTDVIDFKYYSEKLYKDKEFLQAFQFITQGVASIFISDRYGLKENDHSWILWKVLKELKNMEETVFDMSTQSACQFKDILSQQNARSIPFAPGYMKRSTPKKEVVSRSRSRKVETNFQRNKNTSTTLETPKAKFFNFFPCGNNQPDKNLGFNEEYYKEEFESESYSSYSAKTQNFTNNTNTTNTSSSTSKTLANEKKLEYVRTCIEKILSENAGVFTQLEQTFDRADEEIIKKKEKETIKNVHKKVKTTEGNMVFFGDDNWNMVLNMMIGIQMAVRSVRGYQEMIYEEPKDFELKYYFELVPRRFGGQEYQSTIYSFTDYAPNTFNHIRKIFKIENEDYIMSIGPNRLMASLMLGEVNSMTSLTSQGKSGSFFYYTADGKYMLKTIRYKEYKFLRAILKDYYSYIKSNPQTLITRFFGLHKLLEKNQKGEIIGRIYFVIMANVFNTNQKIVERYDLKGSWYGRENTDTDPNATKKDLDFLKRSPLLVNNAQRQKLLEIIRRDAQFFREHEIIDYSLLVGVIKSNSSEIREKALRSSEVLGMGETAIYGEQENSEKYIFGIIDILTEYDSKKVMEYYFKRTFYGEGISAVPPDDYADRFVDFISDRVFPKKMQKQKSKFFKLQEAK